MAVAIAVAESVRQAGGVAERAQARLRQPPLQRWTRSFYKGQMPARSLHTGGIVAAATVLRFPSQHDETCLAEFGFRVAF